jgi:hypothetical protein
MRKSKKSQPLRMTVSWEFGKTFRFGVLNKKIKNTKTSQDDCGPKIAGQQSNLPGVVPSTKP